MINPNEEIEVKGGITARPRNEIKVFVKKAGE
jgi:hypothetical protein